MIKGRGTGINPGNRFESKHYSRELSEPDIKFKKKTEYFSDYSKSVLSTNNSPDLPFNVSLNPYRGCEHGCSYCYARPNHEFLGFSSGLDFETKIMVKHKAPKLLRKALINKAWKPQVIHLSGVTDPYQPIEKDKKLTRGCLKVLKAFRNPVTLITKNHLILRDLDILAEMAKFDGVSVSVSITSLDHKLCNVMEPRTSMPENRLKAIEKLSNEGIPVGIMVAPIIPGLNDYEIPKIIKIATDAGAQFAGYTLLRLPFSVSEIFINWLDTHYPAKKKKILSLLKDARNGKLHESKTGSRMTGKGNIAESISRLFNLSVKNAHIEKYSLVLSTKNFRNPEQKQMTLFSS